MELERLLRSQGFGSKAECRSLVAQGRVAIGGQVCDDPFTDVDPTGLLFTVDDVAWFYRDFVYLAMHKPAGYECSQRPSHYPSIYALLPQPLRTRNIQAVGRLDVDTTGLLLLTDDGRFIHTYTSPKKQVAKVYEVTTRHPVDEAQVAALLAGVELHDDPRPIRATACARLGERQMRLTVTLGKYHLVKRMVAAAGNRVDALHRLAIGDFALPTDLPEGQWMWLEAAELTRLAWSV